MLWFCFKIPPGMSNHSKYVQNSSLPPFIKWCNPLSIIELEKRIQVFSKNKNDPPLSTLTSKGNYTLLKGTHFNSADSRKARHITRRIRKQGIKVAARISYRIFSAIANTTNDISGSFFSLMCRLLSALDVRLDATWLAKFTYDELSALSRMNEAEWH